MKVTTFPFSQPGKSAVANMLTIALLIYILTLLRGDLAFNIKEYSRDVEHFLFLKYFSAVRSVLMIDLDGGDRLYGDPFVHTLMENMKTPCIVRPLRSDKDPKKTIVKMVLTYLINRGRNTGSFICMNTPKTDKLLSPGIKNTLVPLIRNPTVFVFYGMNRNDSTNIDDIRSTLENFFEKVWTELKIPKALGVVITLSGEALLCTYDPNQWTTGTSGRGVRFFTQKQISNDENIFMNERLHEHYQLKISFFERYPTSYKIEDPQPKLFKRLAKESWGYGGLDGFLMGDAIRALKMNATLQKFPGPGRPFGYTDSNGSIGGTLGEIVNMKADIAFNSRFVKGYSIDHRYEYLGFIHSDKLCVVVSKDGLVPLWRNVGRVYSTGVWTLLLAQTLTITVLRWLQLKLVRKRYSSLLGVTIEVHSVIIVPVARANRTPSRERLLLVLCLLINLIFVSLFQSNLHATFSSRLPYPDIHTLEAFDESGKDLYLSPGFSDVFEDTSSSIYANIHSKVRIMLHPSELIDDIAKGVKVATLAREKDTKLNISTNYIGPDGLHLLHVIQECPRNYKLAYIVSRDFPFKKVMNDVMNRLVEAGLPAWYYEMTRHLITTRARAEHRIENTRAVNAALGLQHVAGAFYIMAAGITLALACLAAEIITHRRKNTTFIHNRRTH